MRTAEAASQDLASHLQFNPAGIFNQCGDSGWESSLESVIIII